MDFDKDKLIKATKEVFRDCLMPNGAVVAAPVGAPYFPREAISYMYVWPGRDLGFVLAGMLLIGNDHYDKVLKWIWERAEDFQASPDASHEGLLFRNYHLNGRIYLHYLQPDQNGTLLWSIAFRKEISKKPLTELEKKVVTKAADALARIWHKDHLDMTHEDLWEETGISRGKGVITYSLSAVAVGLESAFQMLGVKEYHETSQEIIKMLRKYCESEKCDYIPRQFKKDKADLTLDASLVGLVWPFNIGFDKEKLTNTVKKIEAELLSEQGVHRYHNDKYEGSHGDWHNHKNEQAGAWPLLTFWLSIAMAELGEREKSEKYFQLVFDNMAGDYYLPEQIFCCRDMPWTGVKPLLWSNVIAVLAAWKLGKL